MILYEHHKITILCFTIIILYTLLYNYYTYTSMEMVSKELILANDSAGVDVGKEGMWYQINCDRKNAKLSTPCLCFIGDEIKSSTACAMTFIEGDGMGTDIGMYSTLLVLSRFNRRPAMLSPGMGRSLGRYFNISIPVLSQELYSSLNWTNHWIDDWMNESYKNFPSLYTKIVGFPSSNTFLQGFKDEIRREFTLKDEIQEKAQKTLLEISVTRSTVTFIGVHVRRGAYTHFVKEWLDGVLAGRKYFSEATEYFRKSFPDAVFLVVSDDMQWCRDNIPNDKGDVYYIGNSNATDPITDFALLMNCNHSIITIGTYGFFAAFLNGGQAVYVINYTKPDSRWHTIFHEDTAYPAHWHPISAETD